MALKLEDIAEEIATDMIPPQDRERMGFDPATIIAILSILSQLMPIIKACTDGEDDPVSTLQRLASDRRPGWRWRQWKVRSVVHDNLGRVASFKMVRDVTAKIMQLGENRECAATMMQAIADE